MLLTEAYSNSFEKRLVRLENLHKPFPRCLGCNKGFFRCNANCNQKTVSNMNLDEYKLLQNLISLKEEIFTGI